MPPFVLMVAFKFENGVYNSLRGFKTNLKTHLLHPPGLYLASVMQCLRLVISLELWHYTNSAWPLTWKSQGIPKWSGEVKSGVFFKL